VSDTRQHVGTTSTEKERARAKLLAAIGETRFDPERLQARTGLHPKTIRRLLSGVGVGWDTLEAVAAALHIQLVENCTCPAPGEHGQRRAIVSIGQGGSVMGWGQAAIVLGIARRTLFERRRGSGCTRRPWWPSREAVLAWYEGLVQGVSDGG